jgi:hypothetical protein
MLFFNLFQPFPPLEKVEPKLQPLGKVEPKHQIHFWERLSQTFCTTFLKSGVEPNLLLIKVEQKKD